MTQKTSKIFCLAILVLALGIPSLAQNTKGDRPVPQSRETRFKTPKKTKQKRQPSRRVRRGDDRASKNDKQPPSRPQKSTERPGRPVTPIFSKSRPGKKEKAWKGDITGRRVTPRKSTNRAANVYPQPAAINYSSQSLKRNLRENRNPNVKRVQRMQRQESSKARVGKPIRPVFHKARPSHRERAWRGDITGRRIRSGSSNKLRPQGGVSSSGMAAMSGRPRSRQAGVIPPRSSGRARNVYSQNSFYVNNRSKSAQKLSDRSQVVLNMLGRHYRSRKATSETGQMRPRSASAAYISRRSTNMWARFPRGKRKQERAITRDLAGKRLRTKNFETQRPVLTNPTLKYQHRSATGERPYKGPAAGGHISRTQNGRAWKGDIAHRALRGGFRSKKGEARPGIPVLGRGPGRAAEGIGNFRGNVRSKRGRFDDQGEEYAGNLRFRKPLKGGGTVTGSWNNKGRPILGRTPGKGSRRIGYAGNIRAGRKAFQDQGEEYSGNIRTGGKVFNDQGEEFTGNIKFRKPGKGGGSLSGKHWNNNNTPILVRTPRGKSSKFAGYQGNLKAGRRIFEDQGEEYSGNIKGRRPLKGGGSVSGKLWNNNGQAVEGKAYVSQTKISRYQGDFKAKRPEKGGGSISGRIWNNNEKPIQGRTYSGQTKLSRYAGNVKAKRPEKDGGKESDFSGNVKIARNDYKRNPRSVDVALPGLKASQTAMKADQHTRGVRRDWEYIRNPSSADDAQRTREPGRAFGRSADFQGNIRVKKFDLFGKSDLHPDARFVKLNKNNVDEEKDMLTNFKLWWARLFRKAETQPDHLKEKDKDLKPRYDKGEAGLWYD